MTTRRPSVFRDALQISPETIVRFDEIQLNELMRDLFLAQAYRCGASVNEMRTNTETKATDDGCDGWSPKALREDSWFGPTDTCWQFKAGTAGQPARLEGEVTKAIPRKTLKAGGRFVVVASELADGPKGERARLKVLRTEAKGARIPLSRIEVIGSDQLANWCNCHPAVAAKWTGRPAGLWRLDEWLASDQHQVSWQPTPERERDIARGRKELDFESGSVHHFHIHGLPGVGKTRFALELCRDADWKSAVVYIGQAIDARLPELIGGAAAEPNVRLMVVADEVQSDQLVSLRDALTPGNGRVRLITIGHCETPDPRRIPTLLMKPLDRNTMTRVIAGWYPSMPIEHVEFIALFADGYVRLANLAANEVMSDTSIDTRGLLDLKHIQLFLDRLLSQGERRYLYVVAALTSVGWAGAPEAEGQAIAKHFRFNWTDVCASVHDFQRRLGIVPRGGRYRYVSPMPLGNYLAMEAWEVFPDLMETLPSVLPNERARAAYHARLQSISSNARARSFGRRGLSSFSRVSDFTDPGAAARWSALSSADPALAAKSIFRALSKVGPVERMSIEGEIRREIVWALARLASRSSAFHDASYALALLAEAENEGWANNATREFLACFGVSAEGIPVPYVLRLGVLDELIELERPALTRLVVRALGQVGDAGNTRANVQIVSDELPEPGWRPAQLADYVTSFDQALARLMLITVKKSPEVATELVTAAKELSMLLREAPFRERVEALLDALRTAYPGQREILRRSIDEVLYREQKFWNELPQEDIAAIRALHARFEDSSLGGRLRQHVSRHLAEGDDQSELTRLGAELAHDPLALAEEWPWLTSGDAAEAWNLGEAMAVADVEKMLDPLVGALNGRGHDLRVLCGFVSKRREQNGDSWFDDWLTTELKVRPNDSALLFEVAWRGVATIATAELLVTMLREQDVPKQVVGALQAGPWADQLPIDVLSTLVRTLIERGHQSTAVGVLDHRLRKRPDELNAFEGLALDLVTSSELIRGTQMANYHWQQLALTLVPQHVRVIAAAIFREQADRDSGRWFIDHSQAEDVLSRCVKVDTVGVWHELVVHLSPLLTGYSFSIGFPKFLFAQMPASAVQNWVAEDIHDRGPVVARLVTKNLSDDETMLSRLIDLCGDDEDISRSVFSAYISGSWSGPPSAHWNRLASGLDEVAKRTALPRLRRWAVDSARELSEMAERELQREEEKELHSSSE